MPELGAHRPSRRSALREKLEEPPGSDYLSSQGLCSLPQSTISGDEGHLTRVLRRGLDESVVTTASSMENGHAIGAASWSAGASLALENDDDRWGDSPGDNCSS